MAYNILIVDDSSPMRAVIKKTIKASGSKTGQIFEAADGKEALDILKKEWIDLVLTDHNMPVMNGLELVVEMKKDEMSRDTPVIMITTEGSRKMVEGFMEEGVRDYIKKPFTPEQIRSKLNNILGETDDEEEGIDNGDEELDF